MTPTRPASRMPKWMLAILQMPGSPKATTATRITPDLLSASYGDPGETIKIDRRLARLKRRSCEGCLKKALSVGVGSMAALFEAIGRFA